MDTEVELDRVTKHPLSVWTTKDILLSITIIGLIVPLSKMILAYFDIYIVTNQRVAVKLGLFTRYVHEVENHQIRDIELHQSFFGRIFGYGNICIYGKNQELHLKGVKCAQNIRELIRESSRNEWNTNKSYNAY
ncbi:PH domain-containing protein [Bacillus thuringiensis]|nr:PH domain-containing protein [Bacillus thuringiensis]MED2784168.1 PH domain-containing protein [Bacillus thuringiensis]